MNATRVPPGEAEVCNTRASAWMKRGIALLQENTTTSLTASLRWFDGAIELRRTLPLAENPWYRYVLAAGWMNRADALTRLGSTENLAEAVGSYNRALTLVQTLDLESTPLFRKRLAIAWMNRGITLQTQGTPESLREALESFENAIAVFRDSPAPEGPGNRLAHANALANRGNLLLCLKPPAAILARESAEQALALIGRDEKQDLPAAEVGLRARHIICRAVAVQLADRSEKIASEDLVAVATDAVDEGMILARRWETRGERGLRDLARELFRFGARAYQMHQPHFLPEFLLENLDPDHSDDALPFDPKIHLVAAEALACAVVEIQRDGFRWLNTPRFDRFVNRLRQLRVTQARLEELRREAARA